MCEANRLNRIVSVRLVTVAMKARKKLVHAECREEHVHADDRRPANRRKSGERYPSGKLKPRKMLKPDIEPMSPALWQRIRQHGRQLGADPRLETELGLSLLKTLNAGETPGFLWLSEF